MTREVQVNSTAKTSSPQTLRLSKVLFEPASRKFASFSVVPSNVSAVETSLQFATGLTTFAVILGPSGWGKTHLLESVAERLKSRGGPVQMLGANEWLASGRLDHNGPLLLDDVLEVSKRPRLRVQLRIALERRFRSGRPTLLCMSANKRTRQLSQMLPSSSAWQIGVIGDPAAEERILIVNDLAKSQGLSLSVALTRVIAYEMRGSGSTVQGALKRLRLMGALWNDVNGTLKAFGILDPCFCDNGNWDFARHIVQTARNFPFDKYSVDREELLAFTMLKEASLGEEHAARAMRMHPGETYQLSQAFERTYRDSDLAALAARQFAETIINGLVKD